MNANERKWGAVGTPRGGGATQGERSPGPAFGVRGQRVRRHCERPTSAPASGFAPVGRAAIPSVRRYRLAEGIAARRRNRVQSRVPVLAPLAMTEGREAGEPV